MKASIRCVVAWIVVIQFVCLSGVGLNNALAASNISESEKYAWSENVDWQNWRSYYAQATVETNYLTGFVWAENIGWIKLGVDAGGPYLNTDETNWGVNRNESDGTLSGYAWSENAGWINISPMYGGVTIDKNDPYKFNGYAWSENVGWIHFQNASPSYAVALDGPLVVNLISFTATGFNDHVALNWETASEIDTAGFYLLRREGSSGDYKRITQSLIPAEGSATSGATYTYTDRDVTGPNIYYYKLEDVSTSGGRSEHGPVSAAVGNVSVGEVSGTGIIPTSKTADGIGDINITGTGTHTVTTLKYGSNPAGQPPFTATGDYWFVSLDNTSGITKVTLAFTPAQSKDTVYYWNGSAWVACSSQAFSNDTITVTITGSTNPRLHDFDELIFALGRESGPIPTLSEWGMMLLGLLLLGATVWRIRRQNT